MWIAWSLSSLYFCIYILIKYLSRRDSPSSIYFLTWTTVLLLYSMHIVKYKDINATQYVLLVGAGLSFLCGTIFSRIFIDPKNKNVRRDQFEINDNKLLKWFITLSTLSMVGLLLFLSKLFSINTIAYFSQHLNILNFEIENIHFGVAGYLEMLAVPSVILYEIYFLKVRRAKFVFILFLDFLPLLLTTRRSMLVFTVLSMLIVHFYWTSMTNGSHVQLPKRKVKQFLFYVVVVIAVIVYFTSLQHALFKSVSYNPKYFTVHLPDAMNDTITYLTGGIAAIPAFLKLNFKSTLPLGYTLRPIYTMMNNFLPSLFPVPYFVREFVSVPITTNVVPYFLYFYFDGGFIYMTMIIFLLAYMSERIFMGFLQTLNPYSLVLSAFFTTGFILSIRQNVFITSYFWFCVIIIYVVFKTVLFRQRSGIFEKQM